MKGADLDFLIMINLFIAEGFDNDKDNYSLCSKIKLSP